MNQNLYFLVFIQRLVVMFKPLPTIFHTKHYSHVTYLLTYDLTPVYDTQNVSDSEPERSEASAEGTRGG